MNASGWMQGVLLGLGLGILGLGALHWMTGRTPEPAPGEPPAIATAELTGTRWEVDMSKAQGRTNVDATFRFAFMPEGRASLQLLFHETDADPLDLGLAEIVQEVRGPTPGRWSIDPDGVHVSFRMLGQMQTDRIEVRDGTLFYHDQPMQRMRGRATTDTTMKGQTRPEGSGLRPTGDDADARRRRGEPRPTPTAPSAETD